MPVTTAAKFRTREAIHTGYCAGNCRTGIRAGQKMYVALNSQGNNIGNYCASCGASRFEPTPPPVLAPPPVQMPLPLRPIIATAPKTPQAPMPAPPRHVIIRQTPAPIPASYVSGPNASAPVADCYCHLLPQGAKCGPCYDAE